MRSGLLASLCKSLSPLTSPLFCSAFGSVGRRVLVEFPLLAKNARNVHVGNDVQIGYGTRLLLHRQQELRIGDGTTIESFVTFESGAATTIGRNCVVTRGTHVPAGTVLADGATLGTYASERTPGHSLGPSVADVAASAFAMAAVLCFLFVSSWIAWIALGLAALLSEDDVALPGLSLALALGYLATVGWGEDHTAAADNLVLCLVSFVLVSACRAIVSGVRARPPQQNRPETTA